MSDARTELADIGDVIDHLAETRFFVDIVSMAAGSIASRQDANSFTTVLAHVIERLKVAAESLDAIEERRRS